MKLKVLTKPNTLNEAALLIGKAISHKKGEKIKLLKDPEKYGLTELDLYERYGDFIDYTLDIYDAVKDKIDELEILHPYLSLNKFSNFLTEIVIHNEVDKIENFNFKSFKEGSLRAFRNVEVMDGSKDLDELSKEVEDFLSSDIDLSEIINLMDSMVIGNMELTSEDKFIFLDFFNKLEEIYPVYMELLQFSHSIYIESYPRVEKYVNYGLEKLKINGKLPTDSKEITLTEIIDVEGIRESEDDIFYYYISTILYNGLSITASTSHSIPILGIQGALFHELDDLQEDEGLKFKNVKEQLKALGDSTRFNIINLLNDKPYYLKELADALKLTSPTISHHMDELLQAGLVKITSEGRRIYYSLNFDSMKKISEFFQKFQEV